MSTIISVQARLGSTRLPGKVLFPLGSDRIIELVLDRCLAVNTADTGHVAIGDRPENEALIELCRRRRYQYTVGPEDDLLRRHLDVAEVAEADVLVRITGDCPFVPTAEIDRVVARHERNDARYTTNHHPEMPIGTAVDVIDTGLLRQLLDDGENHPVRALRDDPDAFAVSVTPNDDWTAYTDVHLAVDTPDDYWTLTDAVEAVGTDPESVAAFLAEPNTS